MDRPHPLTSDLGNCLAHGFCRIGERNVMELDTRRLIGMYLEPLTQKSQMEAEAHAAYTFLANYLVITDSTRIETINVWDDNPDSQTEWIRRTKRLFPISALRVQTQGIQKAITMLRACNIYDEELLTWRALDLWLHQNRRTREKIIREDHIQDERRKGGPFQGHILRTHLELDRLNKLLSHT